MLHGAAGGVEIRARIGACLAGRTLSLGETLADLRLAVCQVLAAFAPRLSAAAAGLRLALLVLLVRLVLLLLALLLLSVVAQRALSA